MEHIDVVDAEGEPLLLSDAAFVQSSWRGMAGDGSDYERACNILVDGPPGHWLIVGTAESIIWDMEGPGTADVFVDTAGRIVIVRAWTDDPVDLEAVFALAIIPLTESVSIGNVRVTSGVLAILSSVANGNCIQSLPASGSARPTGTMASTSSGLMLHVPAGNYVGLHDEVSLEDGQSARRCHLIRK